MSTPNPEARRLIRAYLLANLPLDAPADHALRAGLEATTPGDALPHRALTVAASLGPFSLSRLSDIVTGRHPLTDRWRRALGAAVPEPLPDPRDAACLALLQAGATDSAVIRETGLPRCRVEKIRREAEIAPARQGARWTPEKNL